MIDCWKWFGAEHKIHCDNIEERDLVLSEVKGSHGGGAYSTPGQDKEFDVIVPSKLENAALRIIRKHRLENTQNTPISFVEPQRLMGGRVS